MFTKISKDKKNQYKKIRQLVDCRNKTNINLEALEKYYDGYKKSVISLRNYSYKELNTEKSKIHKSDRKNINTKIKRGSNFSRPKMPVQTEICDENMKNQIKTEGSNKKEQNCYYPIDNFSELFHLSHESQIKPLKIENIAEGRSRKIKHLSQPNINREANRSSSEIAYQHEKYSPNPKKNSKRHSFKITTHSPEKTNYNKTYQHIMGNRKPIHAKLTKTRTNYIKSIPWREIFKNKMSQDQEYIEDEREENELGPWGEEDII